MKVIAASKEAVDLFHRGALALSKVEARGVRIDTEYLRRATRKTEKRIARMKAELMQDPVFKKWKRRFGQRTKLGAPEQLAKVVFDDLGYKPIHGYTKTMKYKANEEAFQHIQEPFVKSYFDWKRLQKALTVNLNGLSREVIDELVHGIFNLNVAVSFRSSMDTPNLQNVPVRNPEIGTIIRKSFIARKRYRLGEIDFGKIEVVGASCYTLDPVLIKEVSDPKADMHRDTAVQLFCLDKENAAQKAIRQTAKNAFVFAEFYGSFWRDCAYNIWEDIDHYNLQTLKGVPLKKHLKRKGVDGLGEIIVNHQTGRMETEPGTFYDHVREVEDDFWKNRFKVYAQWKRDWWAAYLKRGWFRTKTGFICRGNMDRKQVCNYPIQGSAFHCLLWSLIRLQEWLEKHKFKTRIIGQIHDSMLIEFYCKEVDDVLHQAKKIMTEDIRKAWDWTIVPMTIEAELAEEGESWADKKKYPIAA
mgnify:CR=1 FL=1